jgi:NDP-sugar pyrophosphorylase family protein
MQAVILAGGAGVRLRPLTLTMPKSMIDVNGKPFLLYIIEKLKKSGINDLVLCIGYLADKFKEYLGDGRRYGIKISYSVEKEFLGTAGAVKLAEKLITDDFFLINGDTYLAVDYADIHRTFQTTGKLGLMVAYDNQLNVAEANIAIGSDGLVAAYGKHEVLRIGAGAAVALERQAADYRFVDAGVQLFKREVLGLIAPEHFVSFEADIFPCLIKEKQLAVYPTAQRFYDLGTPERLAEIRREFA